MNTKLNGKSDTHSHPYLNTANVANNLTTTSAGYALDARQGKVIQDKLAVIGVHYTKDQYNATGNGSWQSGTNSLTVPKGTYIIIRKAVNISGNGITCGATADPGQYSAATGNNVASYINLVTYTSETRVVVNYYLASGNTANLYLNIIRIA